MLQFYSFIFTSLVNDQQSLKSKQHSESSLSAAFTSGGGGDMNDIISVGESMRSSEFEFEASSVCDEIGTLCQVGI